MIPLQTNADFLAGVIEGFYGQPWTRAERFELFKWMADWNLNTYLYAPKDDLKHRALWRELYATDEAEAMKELIRICHMGGVRFIYGLSPGLDIRFSEEEELDRLRARFEQMLVLGCENLALLFDDIPDQMRPEDQRRWGSFASAQCHVANALFHWSRERCPHGRFLFCPTAYCERMAQRHLGGLGYLDIVGRELAPEVDVLWTGPEIISQEITVSHVRALRKILRRKPLIWDNLHANDYDGRRFYCGPYEGRPAELRAEVAGLLANPNNEFPLNYVPLRTLAAFIYSPRPWDARRAYLSAMGEWLPRFATVNQPVTLEDLILFGDCYYLPHEDGPQAEALYELARSLLASDRAVSIDRAAPFRRHAVRLRDFCARLTDLRDRPLFYALNRRIWELREELDLLLGCVQAKEKNPNTPCHSDSHLPGTYRGGMVARLQRLLTQCPDGAFTCGTAPEAICPNPKSTPQV